MITVIEHNKRARITWNFSPSLRDNDVWVPNISAEMENWLESNTNVEWIWEHSWDDSAVAYKIGAYINLEDLVVFKLKYKI